MVGTDVEVVGWLMSPSGAWGLGVMDEPRASRRATETARPERTTWKAAGSDGKAGGKAVRRAREPTTALRNQLRRDAPAE